MVARSARKITPPARRNAARHGCRRRSRVGHANPRAARLLIPTPCLRVTRPVCWVAPDLPCRRSCPSPHPKAWIIDSAGEYLTVVAAEERAARRRSKRKHTSARSSKHLNIPLAFKRSRYAACAGRRLRARSRRRRAVLPGTSSRNSGSSTRPAAPSLEFAARFLRVGAARSVDGLARAC
jgi:hypothetical protein